MIGAGGALATLMQILTRKVSTIMVEVDVEGILVHKLVIRCYSPVESQVQSKDESGTQLCVHCIRATITTASIRLLSGENAANFHYKNLLPLYH